jgi:hypothetical protein
MESCFPDAAHTFTLANARAPATAIEANFIDLAFIDFFLFVLFIAILLEWLV